MRRTKSYLVCVVALCLGVLLVTGNRIFANDSECSYIKQWIQAHASNLPHEIDELTAFPDSYRRAIVASLSPATRSRLWREHLRTFLQEHPEFTSSQKALILEVIDFATADFFNIPEDHLLWSVEVDQPIAEFEKRAEILFPRKSDRSAFYRLGGEEVPHRSLDGLQISFGRKVSTFSAVSRSEIAAAAVCNCPTSVDCEASALCGTTGSCPETVDGCGFLGTRPCKKLCGIPATPES